MNEAAHGLWLRLKWTTRGEDIPAIESDLGLAVMKSL